MFAKKGALSFLKVRFMMSYALKRKVLAVALSLAGVFSARAQDVASVTVPMSFAEFYRIVENVKKSGGYKEEAQLPTVRAWLVSQIDNGKAVPDVAIPAPVVLDDTTVRPKFAAREYRSGEKIFLLGDSLTHNASNHKFGYGNLLKKGLEVWGKTEVTVEHHGRSGSTTQWMRGEAQNPDWDWLFLLAGINDANKEWQYDEVVQGYEGNVTALDSFKNPELHPTDETHADYCANVVDIVRKSKASGAQVILATVPCNGEVPRSGWLSRHEPSRHEYEKYNPMCRDIAYAEQVPLIDFWKYWMGGPYLTDAGTVSATEYTGFIENNQQRSYERLMEDSLIDWSWHKFLTADGTHLYFQGYRDVARRLLTTMGCPASKMAEIEEAWWNMPEVYDVTLALTAEQYGKIKAGAEAAGLSEGKYVHDMILFPVGKPAFATTKDDLLVKDGAKCLLVGDSIMAYGATYGYAPLSKLFLEKLGVGLAAWDCNGAGGRKTSHLVDESSDCYLPKLLNAKDYDFVFIQIGVNDWNMSVTWEAYTSNLKQIFKMITDADATPILVGICSNNADSIGSWPNLQKAFCAGLTPQVLYCDCAKFETEAYKVDQIKNSIDGTHPNYYGYRWMAWAMMNAIGAKDADKDAAIAFFDDYYKSVMYFSVDFLDADVYGRTALGESQSVFRDDCATAPAEPSH